MTCRVASGSTRTNTPGSNDTRSPSTTIRPRPIGLADRAPVELTLLDASGGRAASASAAAATGAGRDLDGRARRARSGGRIQGEPVRPAGEAPREPDLHDGRPRLQVAKLSAGHGAPAREETRADAGAVGQEQLEPDDGARTAHNLARGRAQRQRGRSASVREDDGHGA